MVDREVGTKPHACIEAPRDVSATTIGGPFHSAVTGDCTSLLSGVDG